MGVRVKLERIKEFCRRIIIFNEKSREGHGLFSVREYCRVVQIMKKKNFHFLAKGIDETNFLL